MKTLIGIAFLSLLVPSAVAVQTQPAADVVLLNGNVFTAEPGQPSAQAVAIRGERIIAVGTSAEVEKLAAATTRRIDLHGLTIVPGFNDAHFHFVPDPKVFRLQFKTLEPSWEETSVAIRQAIKLVPAGTWIFGSIGHDVILNDQVTRMALDSLAPDHPVLLRAYYGHGYALNSRAMPLLRIAEDEADPAGGYYERRTGSRQINGRLWEYAEWKPNRALADQVSDQAAIEDLRRMAHEAIRLGITSMQIFPSMPVARFVRLLVRADLPIRVRAIPFSTTTPAGRDLSEIRQLGNQRPASPRVTASGMKWILDGTPFERGAALRRDYSDLPGWHGRLNFPAGEISAMVDESIEFKQQLLVHAVGDSTVQMVLGAMEKHTPQPDWPSKRVRIEHGDGMTGELIARALRLGVVVVQNPTHFSEPGLFHERWGTGMLRLRSLIEAGIPVALGSDGPMNPFVNIMFSTIHPYDPKEAITREQSVRAYTQGSAFAEFAEGEKGTITIGKLADLAVLSQDIFTVAAPDLPKTSSVLTMVGGKIVYEAPVARGKSNAQRRRIATPRH
jgi:predicted amidohydrolase YtcJ